jgi:hypothetical protein
MDFLNEYFEPIERGLEGRNTASQEFGKTIVSSDPRAAGIWGSDGDGTKCRAPFPNAIEDSSEI